jgi:hypothetical protein
VKKVARGATGGRTHKTAPQREAGASRRRLAPISTDRLNGGIDGCRNAPLRDQLTTIPFDSPQLRVMFDDADAPLFRTA